MTQNCKLTALEWDMKKITEMLEKALNEGTKPTGERQPGERCMYEIQRAM